MTDTTYQIIKATTRPGFDAVEVDGKQMPFSGEGFCRIKDPGVAAEVRARYGGDVTVTPVRISHPSDRGHKYTFRIGFEIVDGKIVR